MKMNRQQLNQIKAMAWCNRAGSNICKMTPEVEFHPVQPNCLKQVSG